jgi:hypothetical protein
VPHQGDEWAAQLVERLVRTCGHGTPDLWRIRLDHQSAPALAGRLAQDRLTLDDLLRDPADRDHTLDIVPLTLLRDGERTMTPAVDAVLQADDQLLLAGRLRDRAALDTTLTQALAATYVVDGTRVPSSWIWRRLARRDPAGSAPRR